MAAKHVGQVEVVDEISCHSEGRLETAQHSWMRRGRIFIFSPLAWLGWTGLWWTGRRMRGDRDRRGRIAIPNAVQKYLKVFSLVWLVYENLLCSVHSLNLIFSSSVYIYTALCSHPIPLIPQSHRSHPTH